MQFNTQKNAYPLSGSQMNIWRLEQSLPGTPVNNICETVFIRGRFDTELIQKTLNLALQLFGTLRTRICLGEDEKQPMQYETKYIEEHFPVFDFSLSGMSGFSHWESSVTRETMPLIDCPLYYFAIIRLGEHEGGIFIKTHHLISDGWSQVLLTNRIARIYLDLCEGKQVEYEPSPDYRLHVEAEQEYLHSKAFARDRSFWEHELASDFSPAVIREFSGAAVSPVGRRRTFAFSEVLNHAVYNFCVKNRVAPFSVFYMALAIYLHRMGQNRRFCLGVPIYNRSGVSDRESGGMFVSTLPLFGELDENWTFEQFNEHFTEQWYDLLRHQRFPFSEITGLSGRSERLFDMVLSFQSSRIYAGREASVHFSGQWNYSGYQAEHLCIHLSCMESEKRCAVSYDYLTQLFSESEIERLHGYLVRILTQALEHPDRPVWQISMLSLEEREKVLYTFNRTDRPALCTCSLYERLHAQALEHPDRVAVIAGGQRYTYREILSGANRIAHAAEHALPGGGGVIAVVLEKGADLVQAMTGIAQAGHAWVLIPTDTPPARARDILTDSGAAAVVAEKHTARQMGFDAMLPVIDPAAPQFEGANLLLCPAQGSSLAYIVYTSGSTGKPKGVEIEQRSLLNFAMSMQDVYGRGAVLSLCSIGFDAFILESMAALLCGRTLLFPVGGESEDPRRLAGLITGYAAGFLACTPSRLQTLLREPDFARALRRIETVLCGGEPFPGELVRRLRQCTDARIYNQYGPSETTIGVSLSLLNDARSITAGRPMPGCRLYVLDERRCPLPVGACGELYIGGLCVGRGYHNLPELTAEHFFDSPFEPDERLYRTGDLACLNDSGELVLRGRTDGQVKLRGLRVELSEISSRMAQHPDISAAAARLVSAGRGQSIVLYYVCPQELPHAALLSFAATYLPSYMIPSQFIRVAQLPLTASGKVDFARLPAPQTGVRGGDASDECTAQVLQLMRQASGNDDMGAQDDYFACGGDSLGALRLLSELEQHFGVRLRVSDLYAARTAQALSELLGTSDGKGTASGCPIPAAPARGEYPLSPTQQNLYMQSMLDARGISYNMPGALRIHGTLDLPRLENAYRRLIALDPLLRTGFSSVGGRIVQTVSDEAAFSIETLSGRTLHEAFDAFVRPFDLSHPPLIRAGIWNDPDGSQVLLCDSHHIIGDGLSSVLLLQRLTQLYAGQQPSMPPISYIDYACWLEQGGEAPSDTSLAYWQDTLSGMPDLLDLPCDKPRPRQFDYSGGTTVFFLDQRQSELCRSACRGLSLTPFSLFAGAFGLLLHALSGQADFAVGTPVSGRRTPGTQNVAGPFIRSLPLRFCIRSEQAAAQYLSDVQQRITGLLDHQDIALEQIISMTGASRRADRGTLYSTLISMRPAERGPVTLGDAALVPEDMPSGSAKMDLSLEVFETEGRYGFSLEYAASLFEPDSVQLMGRSLVQLCCQLARQPDTPVGELSAWHPADRFRLLEEPLLRCAPFADVALDRLFDMRALASPDTPAVLWHGESLSFKELHERSNAVAAQLLALGLARNAAVGVAVRRTPDLLAALLGILKAGFAYVPLSESLPAQRIAAMIRTAGVSVVLCSPEGSVLSALPDGCRAVVLGTAAADFCPPQQRQSSDLFNILFTSGSTGAPKGVMLQHRAVSNLFSSLSALLGPADGPVLCSTSILFDTFITETLIPLAMGRTVILADEEEMLPPHRLAALMESTHPAVMQLTPSRLQMCLGFPAFCQAAGKLKLMILAGEALPSELVLRLRRTGCARVVNLYGPTEAAVYATGADVSDGSVTIGTPLFNCRALVCDEQLRTAPPLARGELLLGGECLALGYAGDPDLTQQSFIPDPERPGARLYRTGDIVRLRADGQLTFIGRRDRQIKLNGQRVEPDEVTGALLRQPGVAEAEVLARALADGSQALHAFVVPAPGAFPGVQALQEALSRELPSYMVPRHISLLDFMPRTQTGKADLRALAAHAPDDANARQTDAPRDSIEQLWQKALGRNDVSPSQSFFEQGGTSLGALSLLSQYYDLGFSMTLAQFYENPTLHAQRAILGLSHPPAAGPGSTQQACSMPPYADSPLTEVLLTGATGFFGAHLVCALLDAGCKNVLCLVRCEEQALWDTLEHYFGAPWLAQNRSRIHTLKGDLAKPDLGLSAEVREGLCGRISHIIHAAADVRHYAADSLPEEINVRGTARIIALARDTGAFLAHVSTVSISGDFIERDPQANREFDENDFDIGQNWRDNVYVRTKYLAEQQVRAALRNGLSGHIFRIGRLVGRACDGMFQKNAERNSFYGICRGMALMHCMPQELAQMPVEMTPVDLCARALVLLLSASGETFHLFCPHTLSLHQLSDFLCTGVQEVQAADFERELASTAARFPSLMAPLLSEYQRLRSSPLRITPVCRHTVQQLKHLGFDWPQPDPSVLLSSFVSPRTLPEK